MLLYNMTKVLQGAVIICAEYFVVGTGVLFLVLVLQQPSLYEQARVVFVGGGLLFLALATSVILKRVIHKKRPPRKVELFIPYNKYAFPSGHATGLFSITLFLFTENKFLGGLSLFLSLLIVTARVKSNVHDAIDIIGGAILGVMVTYNAMPYVDSYITTYLLPSIL